MRWVYIKIIPFRKERKTLRHSGRNSGKTAFQQKKPDCPFCGSPAVSSKFKLTDQRPVTFRPHLSMGSALSHEIIKCQIEPDVNPLLREKIRVVSKPQGGFQIT
jgi:ribosomal protein L37E